MRTTILICTLFAIIAPGAGAQGSHEYAPLEEREFDYRTWSLPRLDDPSKEVSLRDFARGKRLVLVTYFAPWCGNWKYQAPFVAELWKRYHKHGFDVVAVSEYAPVEETKAFFAENNPGYTVVVESKHRDDLESTEHFKVRRACGDDRTYGSPFNVFLDPSKLEPKGEVLAHRTWVVGGELVEKEVEAFVRERLGLPPEPPRNEASEAAGEPGAGS